MMLPALLLARAFTMDVWIEMPNRAEAIVVPSAENEVVVNGRRIRRLTLFVRKDRQTGIAACRIKKPSGYAALDAALCDAAIGCSAGPIRRQDLEACMDPKIGPIVYRLQSAPPGR